MRFNRLDLNLLVILDTIYSEGSVTKAGKKLNLCQSATSSALGRLREFFDDPLFVQVGRQLQPTPLAEELKAPVRALLDDAQHNIIDRQGFDPRTSTHQFTIAASDYFVRTFLTDIANEIAQSAPGVRLNIRALTGDSVRQDMAEAVIDLLICPEEIVFSNLPKQQLFAEDFVVVACASNKELRNGITRLKFEQLGHIAVQLGRERTPGLDDAACRYAGVQRRVELAVDAFDHVVSFVIGTKRIAMLQRGMAQHYARLFPLTILDLPFKAPLIRQVIQWQHVSENNPAHRWLRQTVIEHFQKFEN